MAEFAIGATVLGTLSSLYFYPYVVLQIPLGVLIDRWGTRILMTLALSIAGIGSVILATASSIEFAYVGRFIIGIGSAVGFLGSLALASKWFPPYRFAMLAGLGMFVAMMSGVFAQGPLAAFVEAFGWREVMWGLGAAAFALAIIIAIFVRNTPDTNEHSNVPKQNWSAIGVSLKKAATDSTVWKIALVASTMSGPMLTLGALWGTPYFETTYDLDRTTAASFVSVLFLAWAFGAPFSGWLSDRIKRRKMILVTGSGILTFAMALLIFIPNLPLTLAIILLAIIGGSGSAMAICFALVRECSPSEIGASVTGIVNSMTVASGAVLQPIVGFILDQLWNGTLENGVRTYQPHEFQTAFIAIFIACVIGFLTCIALKETPVWNTEIRS